MKTLKILWIIATLWVLVYFTYLYCMHIDSPNNDAGIGFGYIMYFLTFPLGLLVILTIPFAILILSPLLIVLWLAGVPVSLIKEIIVPWFGFLFLGYVQWFVLLPKLNKWLDDKLG